MSSSFNPLLARTRSRVGGLEAWTSKTKRYKIVVQSCQIKI